LFLIFHPFSPFMGLYFRLKIFRSNASGISCTELDVVQKNTTTGMNLPWLGSLHSWMLFHDGDTGSIPSQSMRDLWWTKWHPKRFFSEYFSFILSEIFRKCSTVILHFLVSSLICKGTNYTHTLFNTHTHTHTHTHTQRQVKGRDWRIKTKNWIAIDNLENPLTVHVYK
jgi:hypothetical protein